MAKNSHAFTGDYFYQDAKRDLIDAEQLADRMKWVLETLVKYRPSADAPEYIFVLRNGL
jgi:hypothetical protein